MTTKLLAVPYNELDQLETELNQLLGTAAFQGFEVAASFPNSDFTEIIIILQKP